MVKKEKKNKEEKADKKTKEKALVKSDSKKPTRAEKVKQALKVRFALEQEPKFDMYYYRIYRKLRLVRYVCVLIAALFVMSVPMVYSDQITSENFKYLIKYIDLQLSQDSEVYSAFQYESSEHMQFAVYADDIVICTDTALVYYDKLGNEIMRASFGPYENPQLLVSAKYVMVYDRGGTEYAIYNNFKMLHHATTEYPISICALGDGGEYAVVTSNQNYVSEVQVYNHNFKQTNRVQRDLYISDLFMLGNGEFGYAGFTTDEKGGQVGEVCIYTAQSKKIVEIIENKLPLSVSISGDVLRVIYPDSVVWYSDGKKESHTYTFSDMPGSFCYSPGNLALYFSEQGNNKIGYVQILGLNSDSVTTAMCRDPVSRIQWHDGYFYLLGDNYISKINHTEDSKTVTVSEGLIQLLFMPNGQVMGCYTDHTEILNIEF